MHYSTRARFTKNHGFTLIELVIVIVLIGIIAATALPKFSNLSHAARVGAANGFAANLNTQINSMRAQWIANGFSSASTTAPTIFYNTYGLVTINSKGWPTAQSYDIQMDGFTCEAIWDNLLGTATGVPPGSDIPDACGSPTSNIGIGPRACGPVSDLRFYISVAPGAGGPGSQGIGSQCVWSNSVDQTVQVTYDAFNGQVTVSH